MNLTPGRCARRWLAPLTAALPELAGSEWGHIAAFEEELRTQLADIGMTDAGVGRAASLLRLRRHFAQREFAAMAGDAAAPGRNGLTQALVQAVCGYYDLDLRDITGLGHGRMIARHGHPQIRREWLSRLGSGELAGIAMTEAHGGSRLADITSRLVPTVHGEYVLAGVKEWVSRLTEAAVWLVSARDPQGELAAVVVAASSPGVHREPSTPAGLAGWSWGRLIFDGVPVTAHQILSGAGSRDIFNEHLTHYRPLVTATALGAAAAVHDAVTSHLARREDAGEITRARDHALIAAGRAHAQINAGLLACLHAQRLAAAGGERAELWRRTTKALGVDLARQAADELIVLVGASGFQADSTLQKTKRDLDALRYADGMHDSLYRAAGRSLLTASTYYHLADTAAGQQATGTEGHHDDFRADHTG